jgi:hypothetical protein
MININIIVNDIADVLQVFELIDLRKYTGSGTPSVPIDELLYTTISGGIDRVSNRVNVSDVILLAGYVQYYFTDPAGTSDSWYISRYRNTSTGMVSSWSEPAQGGDNPLYHRAIYPTERGFSTSDDLVISKIRNLIGDTKKLAYYNTEACTELIINDHTMDMGEPKMWPLFVSLDDVEKVSATDPYVDNYRFLTFSGTLTDTSDVMVFAETFRFSDVEIYNAYNVCMLPPMLTQQTVTEDHLILQTAIDLLEGELTTDLIDMGAKVKEGDDSFDPTAGFKFRQETLRRLKRRLQQLIDQYMFINTDGVLID